MQAANVLFVDNPVGTGYSYCDTNTAFTTNVDEIATDLVTLFSAFLEKLPVFVVSYSFNRQPSLSGETFELGDTGHLPVPNTTFVYFTTSEMKAPNKCHDMRGSHCHTDTMMSLH